MKQLLSILLALLISLPIANAASLRKSTPATTELQKGELSTEQRKEIKRISLEYKEKFREVGQNSKLSGREKGEKKRALSQEKRAKIRAIIGNTKQVNQIDLNDEDEDNYTAEEQAKRAVKAQIMRLEAEYKLTKADLKESTLNKAEYKKEKEKAKQKYKSQKEELLKQFHKQ